MNKSPFYLILLLGSFIFLISACGKDSPTPTDARSSFLGQWRVTETKKNQTYDVEITADMNSTNGVLIYKFGNSEVQFQPGLPSAGIPSHWTQIRKLSPELLSMETELSQMQK